MCHLGKTLCEDHIKLNDLVFTAIPDIPPGIWNNRRKRYTSVLFAPYLSVYKPCGSMTCKPLMFTKSFVLLVTRIRLCTMALAAMMVSPSFSLRWVPFATYLLCVVVKFFTFFFGQNTKKVGWFFSSEAK